MSRFSDQKLAQPQLKTKFNIIPKTRLKRYTQDFAGYNGLVRSVPGNFVMTPLYADHAEKLYRLTPRSDDVWIVTFPKCGTTWTSELLWLLMNDCDTGKAKQTPLNDRVPFIEMPYLNPGTEPKPKDSLQTIEKMPSPRVIKSHLPFSLLHPKLLETSKVVYVARNPKDVIVSYYHHQKLFKFHGYTGDVEKFAQYFMDDETLYAPFFPHVLDAWSKRDHPNMHFMFYEDMKKDFRGEIEKVAAFLDKKPTEEQLTRIMEHLSFGAFQKNESVNIESGKEQGWLNNDGQFIRKGKAGDWKNHFSPEMNSKLDEWMEQKLAETDLKFVTELEHQD